MIALVKRYPVLSIVAGALIGVLVGASAVGIAWAISSAGSSAPVAAPEPPAPAASGTPVPQGTPSASSTATPGETAADAPAAVVGCPSPTVTVNSAASLEAALSRAKPGNVIALAPGTYKGNFVAKSSGTQAQPITLCGKPNSVLDGDKLKRGYVFHLDGAMYWHLLGFTVTNGQKGVVADHTVGSVIEGLTVTHLGDEGIHLRQGSSHNSIIGNSISDTGNLKEKFGEGIYIGTAKSNWCTVSNCKPDASDGNLIEGNHISRTTAESIDIKEGTTGGIVRKNTFDGSMLAKATADSWVDVKGNNWLIENNVGQHSPQDGYQTHQILAGWGTNNRFVNNTADVDGPGFGYSLTPVAGNVVACSNSVSGAAEGKSNVKCKA